MFLAYELDSESRARLLQIFPPKYADVVCHHVTIRYPARKADVLPDLPSLCEVVGYADSGDGVEVLVVAIDGQVVRPDGRYFHITHSLDREAGRSHYIPTAYWKADFGFYLKPNNSTQFPELSDKNN
jgi:hypothetical protein